MIFDNRICELGEGPFWHPERQRFFWFDILGRRLLTSGAEWTFADMVSAAGWVDGDQVMIASQRALSLFNLETGASEKVCDLEADNPLTRSNDGRADPHGGFWIGTMGLQAQGGAGAIYRYYRGELRQLYGQITVSNAICFAPDGGTAYFADTESSTIMRVALAGADGWPVGAPEICVDLRAEMLRPDGCIVDTEGRLWNAQWGAGRVACYRPDGSFLDAVELPAPRTTCPAAGGAGLDQMIVTSASTGLTPAELAAAPDSGKTFLVTPGFTGQAEHRVIL